MRTIEVAHLLPDLTSKSFLHAVPRSAVYEEAAGAFARGTVIQSVDGPIAVEDLLPGDYIETSRGPQAILWIGSTPLASFGSLAEGSSLTHLTRVLSDTFGPARPSIDLVFGPAARLKHAPPEGADPLFSEGVLSPIGDFADGNGAFEITPPSPVQLFHIAFRRHATFSAGGIDVESYHPGADVQDRLGPTAQTLFLKLFPHLSCLGDFGPVCLPRISRDRLDDLTAA